MDRHNTTNIDWEALKSRIGVLQRNLEALFSPSEADRLAMLHERARMLARPVELAQEAGLPHLCFRSGAREFALDLRGIMEVAPCPEVARLPEQPPWVRGVIPFRGEFLALVELARMFGSEGASGDSDRFAVIMGQAKPALALCADAILGVRSIDLERLDRPAATADVRHGERTLGVTDEGMLVLHDAGILAATG